jgi:hypothetical protein
MGGDTSSSDASQLLPQSAGAILRRALDMRERRERRTRPVELSGDYQREVRIAHTRQIVTFTRPTLQVRGSLTKLTVTIMLRFVAHIPTSGLLRSHTLSRSL